MKKSWLKLYVLISLAALFAVVLSLSCANPAGSTSSGYAALALASAIDGRSDTWIANTFAAEEQNTAISPPAVNLGYAADAGDGGSNDGALKVAYSGESGTSMGLHIFARVTPKTLPTSGAQTISIKVKPVAGCVKKAIVFVAEDTSSSSGWHQTNPAVSLDADTWTTVSLTVDPNGFTYDIWRVGVMFLGDSSDPTAQFTASGTIYLDDFSALDYRKNDYSSNNQLKYYMGSDDSTGYAASWESSSSTTGDGYLVDTITFPAAIDTAKGWGTWAGGDFTNWIYGATTLVDLSQSSITFRVFIPAQIASSTKSGCWLAIYNGGSASTDSTEIWYSNMTTLASGWNTVTVNFADPRLKDSFYSRNTSYDYSKVNGFNLGIGTMDSALQGQTVAFKLDYVDIAQN